MFESYTDTDTPPINTPEKSGALLDVATLCVTKPVSVLSKLESEVAHTCTVRVVPALGAVPPAPNVSMCKDVDDEGEYVPAANDVSTDDETDDDTPAKATDTTNSSDDNKSEVNINV